MVDMSWASATFSPSTNAAPRILQMGSRSFSSSNSKRNWSPGVTGLRKRASSMPLK